MNKPLWQPSPSQIKNSIVGHFIQFIEEKYQVVVSDFQGLYQWSVHYAPEFWSAVWDFTQVIAAHKGECFLQLGQGEMFKRQFFQEAKLNYAENLLRRQDDALAVIAVNEAGQRGTLTFKQLYDEVSKLVQHFKALGLRPGDRVAGLVSNTTEALVAMLATSALGGVWCSCSLDFGINGVMDRFGQVEPKILVSTDEYIYAGKVFNNLEKIHQLLENLTTVQEALIFCQSGRSMALSSLSSDKKIQAWDEVMKRYEPQPIVFTQVPFNHPLFIMFTSGTTGAPKCIVHGVGGTLIQHLKEHQLHCNIKPGDCVFYFTTCGWMMWNWLVSALASGATLVLFDGSPVFPDELILFNLAQKYNISHFGVSAKYVDSLKKKDVNVARLYPLEALRMILSTGSPLAPESYDYVYDQVKKDVCLSSISGGTDIISCFALGAFVLPVWRGEIQTRGLGMKVEVFDDYGHAVTDQKGELVCTRPFPSMPIQFWNDPGDQKYRAAYFSRYPGVWCHGDWIELKSDGGLVIYGRSDAVLNPGGVRIGTGEIYRQVEQIPEILESIAVGQDWDNDERIILFVKLKPEAILSPDFVDYIKKQIRLNASPRHMPAKIIQVPDIPRTKSGKIVELAVRQVIHGRPVVNVETLENPEALEGFKGLPELKV